MMKGLSFSDNIGNIMTFEPKTKPPLFRLLHHLTSLFDCCPPPHTAMSQMAPMSHQLATFHFFSHCVALRLAGAFIVEAPAFIRLVFSLAKVFMSKKIQVEACVSSLCHHHLTTTTSLPQPSPTNNPSLPGAYLHDRH